MLLEKMDCVFFLGGGTFGAAFETRSGTVVKFIPQRKPKGHLPFNATQEFKMHRRFARHDLGWRPHRLRHFRSIVEEEVGVDDDHSSLGLDIICMPKVSSTLDKMLQSKSMQMNESKAIDLGLSLVNLINKALALGMVHHDAKCNNIGISEDGSIRFIDFGRAFDVATLKELGISRKRSEKVLRLAAAVDAWRFQDSVNRLILRELDDDSCSRLRHLIVDPLRTLSLKLLTEQKSIPVEFVPDATWWQDGKVFDDLKKSFSFCLKKHLAV